MQNSFNQLTVAEFNYHPKYHYHLHQALNSMQSSDIDEYRELIKAIDCLLPLCKDFLDKQYVESSLSSMREKIQMVESEAMKNSVSMDLLDNFSVFFMDNHDSCLIQIKMTPNGYFKKASTILLQDFIDKEESLFVHKHNLSSVIKARKQYEAEKTNFEACKDKDFVKNHLEPFAKKFQSEKNKHKDSWKSYVELQESHQEELKKLKT